MIYSNILITGDNGSGKTTIVKIFVNMFSVDVSNILIINAVHDQGVNYFRTVKTFCQTGCLTNNKKIIVIDDLDQLNEQCQQIIRCYLDKYKHNIMCVCSCTNDQKVVSALKSRLLKIKLTKPGYNEISTVCNNIIQQEGLVVSPEAKEYIIATSVNSYRILKKYLEKCKLFEFPIYIDDAIDICTLVSYLDYQKFTELCQNFDYSSAIVQIDNMCSKGYSVIDILHGYFCFIKEDTNIDIMYKYNIIKIICKYTVIFNTVNEDSIELTCFTINIIQTFLTPRTHLTPIACEPFNTPEKNK
jgi:DNA polymerase III delta prime subunit